MRKDKNQLFISTAGSKTTIGHVTAADRLLADLKRDPTVSFICLFADISSGLITIKQKSKRANNTLCIEEMEAEFTADLEDDTCSPKEFALDMRGRDNLMCSDNGLMLLSCAWTNNEARRKFDMFPEVMSGDDTEDTNSEERPLYTLLGKDNNNQSFGHTWCFMPSRALWVFRWIFEHAVPILHPGTACKRVQLIPTDADAQETRAIEAVCGPGKIYEIASHLHCAFHKLDRNLKSDSKYKSKIGSVREKGVNSKAEIDMVLRWLWYFCKHYENKEQVDLALTLLDYYLEEDEGKAPTHKGERKRNKFENLPRD